MAVVHDDDVMLATVAGIIAGIEAFALGAALLFGFFRNGVLKGLASRRWLATGGEILVSKVVNGRSRKNKHYESSFVPDIVYSYSVNGVSHTQTRIGFRVIHGTEDFARKTVENFPEGSSTIVYFDPQNPAEATLERGIGSFTALAIVIAPLALSSYGAFILLGTMGWIDFKPKVDPTGVLVINAVLVLYVVWACTAGQKNLYCP
ncbi:DUF3592 domain-containing protein [bacterium]|nr:DUF3592 domain-containing protein [bacterium]